MILVLLQATSCRLTIASPKSARSAFPDGSVPYSTGSIGHIPYGQLLEGPLLLAEPAHLCDVAQHTEKYHSKIVLAERGECSFTTKLLNAQYLGARLLIISDNIPEDREFVMRDDGKGRRADIPCLFVSLSTGDKLRTLLHDQKSLSLIAQFPEPRKKVAEVSLVLTSADRSSYIAVRALGGLIRPILGRLKVTPYYYTFQCSKCPQSDCFGSGKYCLVDYSNRNMRDGQALILQQVRETIVFQDYGVAKWLDYLQLYDLHCTVDYYQECAIKVLALLDLDHVKVEIQVQEAFERNVAYDGEARILSQHRADLANSGITQVPALFVNGVRFEGVMTASGMFQMVCAGLTPLPHECAAYFDKGLASKGHKIAMFLVLLLLVVLAAFLLHYLAKKCGSVDLGQQLKSQISRAVGRVAALAKRKGQQQQATELMQPVASQSL